MPPAPSLSRQGGRRPSAKKGSTRPASRTLCGSPQGHHSAIPLQYVGCHVEVTRRELGVDHVIDYRTTRFENEVRDVDLVLDTRGGETQDRSWSVLRQGGTLVSIVEPPSQPEAAKHRAKAKLVTHHPNARELEEITRWVERGKLKVFVDPLLSLAEVKRAHEISQLGHTRGKIVLQVA